MGLLRRALVVFSFVQVGRHRICVTVVEPSWLQTLVDKGCISPLNTQDALSLRRSKTHPCILVCTQHLAMIRSTIEESAEGDCL